MSFNDLIESSLDLEYAGGMAPNATVLFVNSTDVWTSISYAVDQDLAPVISTSYGYCEPLISMSNPASTAAYFQGVAQQANSMGITWVASSRPYRGSRLRPDVGASGPGWIGCRSSGQRAGSHRRGRHRVYGRKWAILGGGQ